MDSAALAAKLAAYDANPVTSASALNEALGQFGVPEIRNTVTGLRSTVANTTNALNNVDPSVTGRTQGSLVTEAQRRRQVVNEREPIAAQLGEQTGALGTQEKTLQDALSQATQVATGKVNDYTTGRQALASQYDTVYKREQDQAAKALADREFAESQRQFNEQQATSRGSASYGGGSSTAKAPTKSDVSAHIVSAFTSPQNRGKDGFVGQGTWAAALNDWQAIGGSVRDFYHQFDRFVNPQFKTQYAGWAQR